MIISKDNAHRHKANVHSHLKKARHLIGVMAFCLWPALAQAAECPRLQLTGPASSLDTRGYISGYEDTTWSQDVAAMSGPEAGRFKLMDTHIPDFGYTQSKIWLRICVHNATNTTRDWRFYTHENFFQVFELYVQTADGTLTQTMALRPDSPFADRPIKDPEMIAPMTLPPGQDATIYVAYWSGGSSQVDFSIETEASYIDLAALKTAKNFIFYGMMLLLIAVALISLVVFRHPVFLAYCAYSASALLFVMHGDGVAFQYIWPWFPGFNSNATIFTGGGLIVFGAIYARVFLRTAERHPKTDKVLWGFVLGPIALSLVLYFPDPQLLKKLLVMVSLASFLTFILAGLIAYFSGYREARFYVLAWLTVVLSSTLMNMRHILGIDIPQVTVHDSIRAVLVLDAVMMGLAIADRYNQLRKSRQNALEENLVAAQHRLDLNRRLSDLQTRHELAVEMAKSRDLELQNVVHDLRQPLHALRLNVMNLNAGQAEPGAAHSVENAFTYLETLISEQLEADTSAPAATGDAQPGLQEVLSAIEEMFRPDAEAKGLRFALRPSGTEATVDPLVLTRILSNLVANAIKYTERGGVLIGTRQDRDGVRVEVHDTGPGMSEHDFAEAQRRSVRLAKNRDQAPGSGLGLSIAMDLATRHGMRLSRSGMRKAGTGVVLHIPVEREGSGSGG